MRLNKWTGSWAVVTGASKGLGYCYAEILMANGINVVGVARNTEALHTLHSKYPDVELKTFNYDLSDISNCHQLFDNIQLLNVKILINNAGYGVWGYFTETDVAKEMNMIDLNIKALHVLTKLFVRFFESHDGGRVLNVGSLASFVPAPVFSSYYASKAYVFSLGVAINTELKKTRAKTRVITLCPGPLKTDFWNRSSEQEDAAYKSKVKVMPTSVYARKSLRVGLKTKKDFVVVGTANHITKWFSLHAPRKIVLNAIYNYQRNRK